MATRSYGFSRTTMCRMRSSTPRHSSPPHDTHLTSGSSCVFFPCPLRCSNFVSNQNPPKIEGRRNRLSSLDCCAFAPPATLSADETELKGQPVEAPFIANLFLLSYHPSLWICALPLLQLITSSKPKPRPGLDTQTQGHRPQGLCFLLSSDTKTAKIHLFCLRSFFSGSFQADGHGEQRKKQRTFRFGHSQLPRYTALDAVGWVCLLFMSSFIICKLILNCMTCVKVIVFLSLHHNHSRHNPFLFLHIFTQADNFLLSD